MAIINDRIRRLKHQQRKTAKEIAAACGVSIQTVYGWLHDKSPNTKHLSSLSAFLDTSPDWLLNGNSHPHRTALIQQIQASLPRLSHAELNAICVTCKAFIAGKHDTDT